MHHPSVASDSLVIFHTFAASKSSILKIIAIIPARLESSRLPKKVLADIYGMSMLQRTYAAVDACGRFDQIIVATDSELVMAHCINTGMRAMITSADHTSGTDRVAEVATLIEADIVVNVQADEPFIEPSVLSALVDLMLNEGGVTIGTLCKRITTTDHLLDYNVVKLTKDNNNRVMYFSRQAIPCHRDLPYRQWLDHADYYQHLGIYAFAKSALMRMTALSPHTYEVTEKLEQLRWLAHGEAVHAVEVSSDSFGIDTEEDLERARIRAAMVDGVA